VRRLARIVQTILGKSREVPFNLNLAVAVAADNLLEILVTMLAYGVIQFETRDARLRTVETTWFTSTKILATHFKPPRSLDG
jgi:hypothetical protein